MPKWAGPQTDGSVQLWHRWTWTLPGRGKQRDGLVWSAVALRFVFPILLPSVPPTVMLSRPWPHVTILSGRSTENVFVSVPCKLLHPLFKVQSGSVYYFFRRFKANKLHLSAKGKKRWCIYKPCHLLFCWQFFGVRVKNGGVILPGGPLPFFFF